MKKIHTIGIEKVLLFCGFSLALTLAGAWQYSHNVSEAEKISRVQNGIGTCFARVTQTFTAAMIRDLNSPYLKRDFMALSDECVAQGTKATGLGISTLPKAAKFFNDLVTEVYWFHEKVVKVLAQSLGTNAEVPPLTSISEKYAKVESLKLDLQDQLDLIGGQYREARLRDQILVGVAFMLFIGSLLVLALKELAVLKNKRATEMQALTLLNTGNAQIGAMVDQLISNGLEAQGMHVSAQVFRDYHGAVLERMATRTSFDQPNSMEQVTHEPTTSASPREVVAAVSVPVTPEMDARKILTAQAVRLKASMEVQEATVLADAELVSQIIQAFGQRFSSGKVQLQGVRVGDNYQVKVIAENVCFNASELNYVTQTDASMQGVDVNIVLGMDLIRDNNIQAQIKNRTNEVGVVAGAEAIFTLPSAPSRTLMNVVRGKKKDLARTLSPAEFN